MKKYRRLPVAVVATCLVVGMTAAPSALAAGKESSKGKAAATRVTTKALNTRLNSTRKQVTTAQKNLKKLSTDLGALSNRLKTGEGGIALLLGAAPQLVTGLQTLASAVQTQIAPGLLALKTALETQVSPALTQLGTAVKETIPKAIKDVATSQEYGVTALFVNNGGVGVCCNLASVASSDIPDDGNTATASGTFPVQISASPNPAVGLFAEDSEVTLRSAIRSGESDGAATGDPAGQVGGLLTVKCVSIGGCGTLDLDLGGPNAPVAIESGDLMCAVGPTAASSFATPGGPVNLRLVTIQQKTVRTDQTKPAATADAFTVDPLDKTGTSESDAGAVGTGDPAGNSADKACTLPNPGTYEVTLQTQFADIPTSATPGATD